MNSVPSTLRRYPDSEHPTTATTRWANARVSLTSPHVYRGLRVEGRLPADLIGTCYRSGPAIFHRFGTPVGHPFEADGAVTSERFDGNGRAHGAARIIEGAEYLQEERAGRLLYTSNSGPITRAWRGITGKAKNTGNTAIWSWQDRLFALVESGLPTELDPWDLSTLGETNISGILGTSMSAHPHRVHSRSASYNFGIHYGPRSSIELFEFPDRGAARKMGGFSLPFHTMVHDFIATRKHAVFVVGPARLRLMRVLLQIPPFEDWFAWEPERGCEIVVMDLDDPSKVRRIHLDAFWCWHLANGYDEGDDIVIDLARYSDLSSLRSLGTGTPIAPPHLNRLRIQLRSRTARMESLLAASSEFPKVHPHFEGEQHRFVWCQYGTPDEREGIARFDTATGENQVWLTDPGCYVSEPILAPRAGGNETDAWVLTRVYDLPTGEHYTAVLDARAPQLGPVAKVWHGQVLPSPFHGTWVPG
jgi:all-trans-8'-apo-beta-carotenal 15,15'-oxygenase